MDTGGDAGATHYTNLPMLLQLLVLAVASVQADLSVDIDASSVLHAANPLYMVRCRGFVHIYCGRGSSGDMEHPVVVVVRITVLLAHHTHTTTCTHSHTQALHLTPLPPAIASPKRVATLTADSCTRSAGGPPK